MLYGSLTGTSFYTNAVRELGWATYAVDTDGKNCNSFDEPWLTDGYGDYVRHYLRAMATYPELSPAAATETIKPSSKPDRVLLDDRPMTETAKGEGYSWRVLEKAWDFDRQKRQRE